MKRKMSSRLLVGLVAAVQFATTISISAAGAADEAPAKKPHIDLAFCIDTTGSMGSEIENVKTKMKEIVAKIAGGKPAPVIRVGLVAFRDRGDEYVTKLFPFNEDIDKVVQDISSLKAAGGGDQPESVNEALHVAVHDLKWSDDKKALKMLFLVGDAEPHYYANDYNWNDESKDAISRGIMINTIGCLGLGNGGDSEGTRVWKTIAKLTDGKYEPLAYRQEIVNADGTRSTVINSGGSFYKMRSTAGSADWRAGADALTASGKAEMIRTPVAGRLLAAPMKRGFSYGGGGGLPPTTMGKFVHSAGDSFYADEAAAPAAASYGASRAENNLSDIVLSATKAAANKKLNVDFKEK